MAFERHSIRRYYDEASETWYFSVVDVVAALTESENPSVYWRVLKKRLKDDGANETVTKCNALKMPSADGKMRLTDMADTETLLRLIQSIPSPKAEPFKLWLAKVGYERIQDMGDPARSLDRAREYWRQHGRSEKWIQQRMMGQETRNKLTDYWKGHEIKGEGEFAILTNIIHQEWSDVSVKQHKAIKGLKTQNLRDHMSEAELIFTALAELSTRQIAETVAATGMHQDIETIINKSEAVKKTRKEANDEELTAKQKKELTEEEKEYKSKRKMIQEKLIKFATRIPIFMYLTDYRERTLKDVITQLEPGLFKKVTGLTVKDFELLVSLGVFNSSLMNDAVYKFKRYEDASLSYTGINKHEGEDIDLYDTVVKRSETHRTFENVPPDSSDKY